MCKIVSQFLTENNILYDLQFGFRQNVSTEHAIIGLDKGHIGCEIFVDLQKAFDTVDHEILLAKLNYYDGVRGV